MIGDHKKKSAGKSSASRLFFNLAGAVPDALAPFLFFKATDWFVGERLTGYRGAFTY